jgi:hypothetical protein
MPPPVVFFLISALFLAPQPEALLAPCWPLLCGAFLLPTADPQGYL